jgi:tetratricopeptide (TPR) repeat protein
MREIMRRAQSRGRACAGAVLIAALATGAVFASLATGASTAAFAQSSKSSGAKSLSRKDASELVKKAQQAVAAKKPKRALSDLDRAIASGKLRYKDMAQALYQRGLAHRLAGNTPKAIEDLTAAVWIRNGLGADDRKAALAARTEAYAQAGLTSSPGVARAPASYGHAATGDRVSASINHISGATSGGPHDRAAVTQYVRSTDSVCRVVDRGDAEVRHGSIADHD